MMKVPIFFILLLISPLTLLAQGTCINRNYVFSAGERVYYHAYYNWGFIWLNAGDVLFSVDNAKRQNEPVYQLKAIGTTKRGYDMFFKVRDTFEVFVDTLSIKPLEFRQITNEGSYTADHHYIFNKEKREVYTKISRAGGQYEEKIQKWPDCTFDLLSIIYQARNLDFTKYKIDEKIPISLIVDGEVFNLYIRYLGKEVAKNREGRKFNCLKFSPLLVEGTIFKSGEDMTVWVTDDNNRVPIVVEAKILIGSVKAIFSHAEGLRYPMTSEIK